MLLLAVPLLAFTTAPGHGAAARAVGASSRVFSRARIQAQSLEDTLALSLKQRQKRFDSLPVKWFKVDPTIRQPTSPIAAQSASARIPAPPTDAFSRGVTTWAVPSRPNTAAASYWTKVEAKQAVPSTPTPTTIDVNRDTWAVAKQLKTAAPSYWTKVKTSPAERTPPQQSTPPPTRGVTTWEVPKQRKTAAPSYWTKIETTPAAASPAQPSQSSTRRDTWTIPDHPKTAASSYWIKIEPHPSTPSGKATSQPVQSSVRQAVRAEPEKIPPSTSDSVQANVIEAVALARAKKVYGTTHLRFWNQPRLARESSAVSWWSFS